MTKRLDLHLISFSDCVKKYILLLLLQHRIYVICIVINEYSNLALSFSYKHSILSIEIYKSAPNHLSYSNIIMFPVGKYYSWHHIYIQKENYKNICYNCDTV